MRKQNQSLTPIAKELRKSMTKEERHLWYDYLSNYPIRFYRQKVLGRFIADFYCAKAKLVLELDGSQHYVGNGPDRERTQFLEGYGLLVVRIPNSDINRNFSGVCSYIDNLVRERLTQSLPLARGGGTAKP